MYIIFPFQPICITSEYDRHMLLLLKKNYLIDTLNRNLPSWCIITEDLWLFKEMRARKKNVFQNQESTKITKLLTSVATDGDTNCCPGVTHCFLFLKGKT